MIKILTLLLQNAKYEKSRSKFSLFTDFSMTPNDNDNQDLSVVKDVINCYAASAWQKTQEIISLSMPLITV